MKRVMANVGDVFEIQLDDDHAAYGQIVGMYGQHLYWFAVFEAVHSLGASMSAEGATNDTVAILGLAFGTLIANRRWRVVGCAPVRPGIPLPAAKVAVGSPENMMVEDASGQRTRVATPREIALLSNRHFFTPKVLEKALRAKHGLEPWLDAYAELVPNEEKASARLFDPG